MEPNLTNNSHPDFRRSKWKLDGAKFQAAFLARGGDSSDFIDPRSISM